MRVSAFTGAPANHMHRCIIYDLIKIFAYQKPERKLNSRDPSVRILFNIERLFKETRKVHFDFGVDLKRTFEQRFSCTLSNEICSKVYASILTCPKQYAWSLPRVIRKVRLANIPKLQALRELFSLTRVAAASEFCSFSKLSCFSREKKKFLT